MLDLTALEVALGLGFVYLVFSLVISRVNEAVAGVLQWRSKALEAGLHQLLTGRRRKEDLADVRAEAATEDAGRMFDDLRALSEFDHPLLSNLRQPRVITGRLRNPSYVAPQTFSLAVLSILAPERQPNVEAVRVTNRIRARVDALPARRRALADELLDLLPEEGSALSAGDLEQVRHVLDRTRQLTDAQKQPFRDLLAPWNSSPTRCASRSRCSSVTPPATWSGSAATWNAGSTTRWTGSAASTSARCSLPCWPTRSWSRRR